MCKNPTLFWSRSVTPLRPPTASQWASVRITTEACSRSNPDGSNSWGTPVWLLGTKCAYLVTLKFVKLNIVIYVSTKFTFEPGGYSSSNPPASSASWLPRPNFRRRVHFRCWSLWPVPQLTRSYRPRPCWLPRWWVSAKTRNYDSKFSYLLVNAGKKKLTFE